MCEPPADCAASHCATERSSIGPEEVLRAVLAALHASGHRYALLERERRLCNMLASDVDIAFGCDPNRAVLPIIRRICRESGARLVQCLHYEIPFGYYYVIAVGTPPRYLHLDCLYDPLGINRYRLPTSFLLDGVVEGRYAARASDARLALYLLMKRAMKGDASAEALCALRECFGAEPGELSCDLRTWFGDEAPMIVERLLQCEPGDEVRAFLARLRVLAERRFRRRAPARYLLSLGWDATRKARRFFQPTGLFVVLLGPDGAGKSTVAALVASDLARAFRRTWHFHWRPGLFPKLRRSKTPKAETSPASSSPPQRSMYRGGISLLRFVYYWLDFVAGYWLRIYPRAARTTLVVGERYFPDVLVNPARYGFAVPRALLRLAARVVPSPDLVVLLTDRPQSIHCRKPELPVSVVAEQLVAYQREIRYWGEAVALETTADAPGVASRVGDLVLDACVQRTRQRLPRPRWRAFPSAAHARLWVADDDALANAANLYRPYSSRGRMLARSLRLLPPSLFLAWPWTRADANTDETFEALADCIRRTLREQVQVTFASRATDPRRRLTAQASTGTAPLAYVKIARAASDTGALQHEAEMIGWMRDRLAGAAVLPDVLGIEAPADCRLLFVSAPPAPATQRPVAPDQIDVRFLSRLAEGSGESQTAERVLAMMRTQQFLERLAERDERCTELVRTAVASVCSAFGARRIRTAPSHGDYTPWNALTLGDGTLYLFDWEHAQKEAPVLGDLFHRVVMPARLVLGKSARTIIERLFSLYDDPLLGAVIVRAGVQRADVGAYVLLYLLGLAMRDEAEYGRVSDFVREAIECAVGAPLSHGARRNVLVGAYACEPGAGSEPGVGWNVCQAISREHQAWVITRRNNRDAIEAALRRAPNPNLHFYYADLPRWARFWKRGARGVRTYYYLWQFAAAIEAWRLMRRVRFDVAHHVTFVNSYIFSFLALLPVPFVWGPLGSNPALPATLASSRRALVRDRLRYGWQRVLRAVDPLFWLCVSRARVVLGINESIGRHLPFALLAQSKFAVHPAIAVEANVPSSDAQPACAGGVRIVSMGQLIAIKGFHLALRAFAEFVRTQPNATLEIVGDGPEMRALQRLADALEIADRVRFTGWLSRQDALQRLADADIFLFPSCEGGGMVVLEAMAHGLPTVCLEYGGPGEMVGADCGIAVRVGNLDATVSLLARGLATLAGDPSLRHHMGQAARKRVAERYSWELRHEFIGRWYASALSQALRGQHARGARRS